MRHFLCIPLFVCSLSLTLFADAPTTNSIGMTLVSIPAGKFQMGSVDGEFDEKPVHEVTISQPFFMSATEVTNAQYEQFDPKHRELRGKLGISRDDDEAVVFVSWEDAARFCKWLSQKESKPYRLPTEAQWEYACRAGTTTAYNTGDQLPSAYRKNQREEWDPKPIPLHVGKTPANGWGLFDMHGNVEEWCLDWYGPYQREPQTDPIGPATGEFRITRGGSHSTELKFLRSANRSGTLPDDRTWLIGFRVVQAPMPRGKPSAPWPIPRWAQDVSQDRYDWPHRPQLDKPYFERPIPFVRIPPNSNGPLYSKHNHCPDITWCRNGDLLATWYSTNDESGRELTAVAARLRRGASEWDPADVFYKAPDRNMHATIVFFDGDRTLYHINGLSIAHGWGNLALILRTSTDNGATWSQPSWISPEHQHRHQPIAGMFRTRDGALVFACDATPEGSGGTAMYVSRDGGKTWIDPGLNTDPLQPSRYTPDVHGGTIAGIHAKIVELRDGRLMAFGRGDSIDGKMPVSLSSDKGKTWSYSASPFPPITGGQRLILMRLREGPILFVSFANNGLEFKDREQNPFRGFGLYAALSYDDGKTWPVRKLLTPGAGTYDGGAWTKLFRADATHAEPKGYLAATQTPDGVIHLVSSALHYRFNLKWLELQ